MKQIALFGQAVKDEDRKYSTKIEAPIYEPKNKKPHVLELYNVEKTNKLIAEIQESNLPDQEKVFLIEASKRHTVFNYEKIADYYAHSNKEVQNLMERSALVIIDFNKAIEYGYIKLCDDIKSQYMEEHGE